MKHHNLCRGLILVLFLVLFCAPAQAAFPQKPKVTIALDTYDYDPGGSWSFGLLGSVLDVYPDATRYYHTWDAYKLNFVSACAENVWDLIACTPEERKILQDIIKEYRKYWMRVNVKVQGDAEIALSNFRIENSGEVEIWPVRELVELGSNSKIVDGIFKGSSVAHLEMISYAKDKTDRQMNKVFAKAKLLCDITYYPGTQGAFTETIRVSTKNVKRETYYKDGGYRIWMETCEAANPPLSLRDVEDAPYLPESVKKDAEANLENYQMYIFFGFSQKQMLWNVRSVYKSLAEEQDGIWVEGYVNTACDYSSSMDDMYENGIERFAFEVILRKDGKSPDELENWLKEMAFTATFGTELVGDEENIGYDGIQFTIPIDTSAVRFVR